MSANDSDTPPSKGQQARPLELKLEDLVRVWANPLEVYLRDGLGIRTWLGDDEYAEPLLPLAARRRDLERAGGEILEHMLESGMTSLGDEAGRWKKRLAEAGILSVGAYGTTEVENLIAAVSDIVQKMKKSGFMNPMGETRSIDLRFFGSEENEVLLRDEISGVFVAKSCFEMHSARAKFDAPYACDRHRLRFKLMALNAVGIAVKTGSSFNRHHQNEDKGIERTMVFAESLTTSSDLAEQCLERLRLLCDLYQSALVRPMARFGATAEKLAETIEDDGSQDSAKVENAALEFEKFCRGRDFEESVECRVFGSAPRFDEVFGTNGAGRKFAEVLHNLGKEMRYVISW